MDVFFEKEKKTKRFDLSKKFSFLKNKNSLFYYYVFLLVVGFFFFISSTFINKFTTPFTGDYTSQQYAFYTNGYDDWWHFFKTGEFILYDANTFLGVNNIGSNSFYYLFDPFFMPILLCPRQFIPQGMVVLTIFKMATAGLVFYFYMRIIGASSKASKISGLAYAFAGWTAWYLWFNHMTEITIVFPFMLIGVERVLKTKKPWLLALSIFVMGITNFFFLVCCTFAAFFYALFRYFQQIKSNTAKDNLVILGMGFLGFAVGLMMSCVVVLPAAMVSLNAPRAQNKEYLETLKECIKNLGDKEYRKQLWNVITSWENLTVRSYQIKERNFFPLIEYIFPAMTCREVPLVDYAHSYDNVGGSLFVFYPIVVLFVPALINSCRNKHYSPLIATALFIFALFTPFAYYMFHGFTDEPYSRWTLFVETSLIAYVGCYLDKFKQDKNWTLLVGALSTQGLIILGCILANKLTEIPNDMFVEYVPIKLAGIISLVYVGVVYALLRTFKDKKYLNRIFIGLISIEAVAMGTFVIQGHGVENYVNTNNGLDNNNELHKLVKKIQKDDPSYYRCYSSQENSSARNDGMRNGYNGLGFFHSVYNFNLSNFLNWSAINDGTAPGSWSGSYVEKRMNLDTFLGIKYYFINKDTIPLNLAKDPHYRCNVPLNFVDVSDKYQSDKYFVYENKNFVNLGFTYDKIYTYNSEDLETNTLKTNDVIKNEEMYLEAAITDYKTANMINSMDDVSFVTEEADYKITDAKGQTLNQTAGNTKFSIKYYNTSKIKPSYLLSKEQLLRVGEGLENCDVISNPGSSNKINDQFVTVIKFPVTDTASYKYDPDGMIFYLKNYYNWDYRINVYFVDKDNNIVTFDDHNDQKLNIGNYSGRKTWRGFYISPTYNSNGESNHDAPEIKKMIIVNKGCHVCSYQLYEDTMTNYQNRVADILANPLTDVTYKANHFGFKTNFTNKRIVVTQIPYEDGWSITAKDKNGNKKELEVFEAQGGFVSFISEKGEWEYSMDYFTPYLQLGSYIALIGLTMFLTSFIGYYYITKELESVNCVFDEEFKRKSLKTKYKLTVKTK